MAAKLVERPLHARIKRTQGQLSPDGSLNDTWSGRRGSKDRRAAVTVVDDDEALPKQTDLTPRNAEICSDSGKNEATPLPFRLWIEPGSSFNRWTCCRRAKGVPVRRINGRFVYRHAQNVMVCRIPIGHVVGNINANLVGSERVRRHPHNALDPPHSAAS
jgi:hypothetical protein